MWNNDLVLTANQLEMLTIFLHYNGVPIRVVKTYYDMAYGLSYHDKKHVERILEKMQEEMMNKRVWDVMEQDYVNV